MYGSKHKEASEQTRCVYNSKEREGREEGSGPGALIVTTDLVTILVLWKLLSGVRVVFKCWGSTYLHFSIHWCPACVFHRMKLLVTVGISTHSPFSTSPS